MKTIIPIQTKKAFSAKIQLNYDKNSYDILHRGNENLINIYCIQKTLEILEKQRKETTESFELDFLIKALNEERTTLEKLPPAQIIPDNRDKKKLLYSFLSLLQDHKFNYTIEENIINELSEKGYEIFNIIINGETILVKITKTKIVLRACIDNKVIQSMTFWEGRLIMGFEYKVESILKAQKKQK
ncbi:MAG: hypothetical protein K2X86_14540 [Cytophagaceae bacterium]|nr:hypothetical protein [Cytophagaceae bacterium]